MNFSLSLNFHKIKKKISKTLLLLRTCDVALLENSKNCRKLSLTKLLNFFTKMVLFNKKINLAKNNYDFWFFKHNSIEIIYNKISISKIHAFWILNFHRNGKRSVFKTPLIFNYLNINFNQQNFISISKDRWKYLKKSIFLRFFYH